MVSSSDNILSIYPSKVVVPIGATAAVFIDVAPGEQGILVKYSSGGTLELLPASLGASFVYGTSTVNYNFTSGSTQTAAMLIALSGTGYLMGTSEILTLDGSPRFYLSSLGATSIVYVLKGVGAGI